MNIRSNRNSLANILHSSKAVLPLAFATLIVSGCASNPDQEPFAQSSPSRPAEAWSTKRDSVQRTPTLATTPLNNTNELPVLVMPTVTEDLREPALSVLMQAANSTNPLLRAQAIEALQPAPEQLSQVIRQCLGDSNRGVRFSAAMTVGRLQITDLAPLLEPLLHDESESVQAAAIYGLNRCKRTVDVNPLAKMLLSENPEVKGNAAMIVGELGDKTAIPMLRHAAGKGLIRATSNKRKIIDLQLAEAMVKLGAVHEIDAIRAALFSTPDEGELVALACQMCGDLNDGGALPNLLDLATRTGRRQQSAEVRLAAALAIAKIDASKSPLDVAAEYVDSPQFLLRAQAAQTLAGMAASGIRNEQMQASLAKLLNDSNALVQVAAAGGILRHAPSEVADGLSSR